jgi:hypothetical protein
MRRQIEENYDSPIFPITLTFHHDDVSLFQSVEVSNFIRRVQTVVLDGAEHMVIQAKYLKSERPYVPSSKWGIGLYDRNSDLWYWNPQSVKSIDLPGSSEIADVVIEKSLSVTEGDIKWTATKTSREKRKFRRKMFCQIIMLDIFKNIETLRLKELVDVSALAHLKNLKFLDLSGMSVADVSALAKLSQLETLDLNDTKVENISAVENLTNLKWLSLRGTNIVDISALTKLRKLESLSLHGTRVDNISVLENLTNLKEVSLSGTKVSDDSVSALKQKILNLVVH